MKVGIGVEGPSDYQFWNKVLPKHFRGLQFDIRNMKNRDKLIRATPDLLDEFRGMHRKAAIIILDRDKDPCASEVLNYFDPAVVTEARKPLPDRYLHIFVSIKRVECWYLADATAINTVIEGAQFSAPTDTASCHGKTEIKELLNVNPEVPVGYNEIEFARLIAPKFSPSRARQHSASFTYFWDRVSGVCSS